MVAAPPIAAFVRSGVAQCAAMGGPHTDRIPDARDGLTRVERVILWVMHEAKKEFGERRISTVLLYGRVVEHVDISVDEFQRVLGRLSGHGGMP